MVTVSSGVTGKQVQEVECKGDHVCSAWSLSEQRDIWQITGGGSLKPLLACRFFSLRFLSPSVSLVEKPLPLTRGAFHALSFACGLPTARFNMFFHLFISDKLIVRLRSFSESLLLAEISHRPRCLLLSGATRRFSFNVFASPPHPHPRWCSLEGLTATRTSWTSSTPSPLCRPLQLPWPTWPSASNEETGVGRRKQSDRRCWKSLHGLVPWGPEDKGKTGNVCQAQGRALTFRCCLFGFLLSFIFFFLLLFF